MFWKQTGTTNGTGKTVTFNGSALTANMEAAFGEWQPSAAATFSLDGTPVSANATSANPSAGNISPSSSSALIVCALGGDGTTATAGSGFTRVFTSGAFAARIAGENGIFAAGSQAANWTAASQAWVCMAAGFKAVA
jgi:hypothetical protein